MFEERATGKYIMTHIFCDGEEMNPSEVVKLLNNLHQENHSLKFQLDECANNKLYSRRKLEEENEQLRQKLGECHKKWDNTMDIARLNQDSTRKLLEKNRKLRQVLKDTEEEKEHYADLYNECRRLKLSDGAIRQAYSDLNRKEREKHSQGNATYTRKSDLEVMY